MRWGTAGFSLLLILVGSITAWYVVHHPEVRIIQIALGIFGYTYGSLLGIFLLGMLTRTRGNDSGNIIAMAAGFLVIALLTELIPLPADFDAEEFLRGAKMAYNRLQAAWDSRDLNDIAQFASPAVMDAVRQQLAEETEPSKTEILLVNAQLLSVVNEDKEQRAQVYFDVLMRERPDQPTPSNVREIWHFVRELDGGTWKLDGIQQVA